MFSSRDVVHSFGFSYVHKTYRLGSHANDCGKIITCLSNPLVIHIQTTSAGGLVQFAFSTNQFNVHFVEARSV